MIKIILYRLFTMFSHFGNNLYLLNGYWHLVSSLSLLSHTRCLYKHDEKSHKLRMSGERDQEPFYIVSSDILSKVTNKHFLLNIWILISYHIVFKVYENFNVGTWLWSLYLVHNLFSSWLWSWYLIFFHVSYTFNFPTYIKCMVWEM